MSPTDDIIDVAGHRLSTGAMEGVVASHPDGAEGAEFGVPATIDDPAILDEIADTIKTLGYPKR